MFSRRSTLALFVMMLLIPISSGTATAEGMDDVSHFPSEPEGEWYVYDVADVISNETEAEWEADLRAAHEESGRLVRLVTIPSMCAFDTYAGQYGNDHDRCRVYWSFDECYDFCEESFAYEDSYAARMFRAYGMWETEEPSMLIGVSTEDRRFRYVIPDHSTAEQRFSGQQFEKHSWRLSDAADGYGSWEDGLEPHVEFGLLVSEGKTAPYPFAVQALLLAGVLTGVLSILVGFGGIARLSSATMAAKNRLSLGCYREMAVLIHARLTLDGNFGAMERYRGHIEAIEKQMAEFYDVVKEVHEAPMAHEVPLTEYEERRLRKVLVEIEACFEEMGSTVQKSAKVESAVAFEPLDYEQDIEQIHTQAMVCRRPGSRSPSCLGGFVVAGVFVAACFVEQGVAWLSVSGYRCSLGAGMEGFTALLTGLIPLGLGVVLHSRVAAAARGADAHRATTVDFAALDWPDFGAAVAGGYDAMLVGHDEHGSPITKCIAHILTPMAAAAAAAAVAAAAAAVAAAVAAFWRRVRIAVAVLFVQAGATVRNGLRVACPT